MNIRKVIGTFAGLVVLAGISYHQVRDGGPDPRDTAIMSGTILAERNKDDGVDETGADEAPCETSPEGTAEDPDARPGADCSERRR